MKKRYLLAATSVICAALITTASFSPIFKTKILAGKKVSPLYSATELSKKFPVTGDEAKKEHQYIAEALEYMHMLRASDPATGALDPNLVLEARQKVMAMKASRSLGPLGLVWQPLGPDNVGGRTRAILIDQDSSNKIYAGAVTGGLWVSENAGLEWQPHPSNSVTGNHSITCIVQAPNGNIFYGTGEGFNHGTVTQANTYGFIGGGIYESTDGGQTFQVLPATQPSPNPPYNNSPLSPWAFVNAMAYRPGTNGGPDIVYAGTNNGLYSSSDGGATWGMVAGTSGDSSGGCNEVVVGGNGSVHAAINNKYYHSDDGVNFTNNPNSGYPTANLATLGAASEAASLAVSPQDPNYVYASIANNSLGLNGVYQSTDNGTTWQPYSALNSTAFNPLGFQGDYDNVIAVDPANKNRVFLGGQFYMSAGGASIGWTQVSFWAEDEINPYYVHADIHALVFDPNDSNTLYVGSDGGINISHNAGNQQPTFTTRNKGYNVTQFYGMDAAVDGQVMAGAQDNGTSYINYQGNTTETANIVLGGDGGVSYISKTNPNAIFGETDHVLQRSSDGGNTFGDILDAFVNTENPSWQFIPAFDIFETQDSVDYPHTGIMMVGVYGAVFFTIDALNFSTSPVWYRIGLSSGGAASAISKTNDGRFYIGSTDGYIYLAHGFEDTTVVYTGEGTNIAKGLPPLTIVNTPTSGQNPLHGRYITDIAVDPNDTAHIVVTCSGYGYASNVFESHNATSENATFTSIQGTLPAMPVYSAVISYYDSTKVIVGTDMGVWGADGNGGTDVDPGTWGEEDNGMSSIPMYWVNQKYQYDTTCQVIYVATYGYGMFRTTTLTPSTCNTGLAGINSPADKVTSMNVYPNPASDKAIISMDLAQPQQVTVQVIDMLGRMYLNKSYGQLSGSQQLQLDVSTLSAGNYLVSVKTGDQVTTKPLVVIR